MEGSAALNVAVALALTLGACRPAEPPRPFAVATVERRTLDIRAEASGVIEPITVVEVKSKASGEIVAMPVDVGDEVRRGELLVQVEETEPRQTYAQAEADLEVARARLSTAEAALRRAQELIAAEVITEQEYEQTALDHASAKAQLVRAQAALEIARERLADVTVRAPIDGTILQKQAAVGQVISSPTQDVGGGTLLLRMADLRQVQIRTLVDETDIGKIRPGLPAELRVEAFFERAFVGEALKIEPQAVVEQSVTMFPVIVRIDNSEQLLKPGMTAEVTFLVARRANVPTVPNQALHAPGDARTVAELALGLSPDDFRVALAEGRGPLGDGGGAELPAESADRSRLSPAERDSLRRRFQRGEVSREELRKLRERAANAPSGAGSGRGARPGRGAQASPTGTTPRC